MLITEPLPRCAIEGSPRVACREPRRRILSPEQTAAIRAEAGNRSLRELASEFGVSHETVRKALRERVVTF